MCVCPSSVHRHAITPRKAQGEIGRRSDRSFVKAPFICENGLDASHYQHVCHGCLSSLGNNLQFRFYFGNERKKESNREGLTIMILSSLHPSISYSTSLSTLFSPVYEYQLFLQCKSIHPNKSFYLMLSLKLPAGLR